MRPGAVAAEHHRDEERLLVVLRRLGAEPDRVADRAAEDLLAPGSRHLVLRQLEDGTAVVLHQLVDGVERRCVGRDAHARPDAERVDRRPGSDQPVDLELVEPAAREDPNVGHVGLVEERASRARELVEVAAVEAHGEV